MGEVYLAEDTRLGRQVALKFLPASFEYDPERRSRFLREARAASALRSPNVAAIYDIGEHDGAQFIAMEYVKGDLLSHRIASKTLSIYEAIDVAIQIADALDEAHSLGIIHRDIKCSNLIVNERGLLKVLDFGLAKLLSHQVGDQTDEDRTLRFGQETMPGMILGTLCYMSPEQTRGQALDARTDIFSLGVVLYEMVTGCKPFQGETPSDLIVAILDREPAPVRQFSAEVPAQLDWIIKKALQKNREERYQSAGEFITDLRNLKQALDLEANLAKTTPLDRSSGAFDARTRVLEPSTGDMFRDSGATSKAPTQVKRRSRKAINSIAILPLVNANPDPSMEYLSDGITEVLINSLSRLPKLRVMARSTTFRYKGQEVDPIQIGSDLGVRAVLTGRVLQLNDNLIVGTELVDVSDGSQLWGEQYHRKMSDIFALQEEISNEILDKLRVKLGAREKKLAINCCTQNTEAYELYLKGRFQFNQWTPEGFQRAIDFFKQAIEKDCNFALAYSGLSDAYGTLWFFNFLSSQEALPIAEAMALKALELDDTLAEAHLSLANMELFYKWNWQAAEKEYHRTIELNPNYADAHHMLAFYHSTLGNFEEALLAARRATELEPLSIIYNCAVGTVLFHAGRYDEAISHLKKSLEFDPNFSFTHEILADIYELKGMEAEAIEENLKVHARWIGDPSIAALLHEEARKSGLQGFWRKWLEFATIGKIPGASPYYIASTYADLGDTENSLEWLEKAYEQGVGFLVHLKTDHHFDNLRTDERFQNLVQRIGIP
jgi:serine/threonine protein kinase